MDNHAIGYFATIPGYWSGAVQDLRNLDYYRSRFLARHHILELGLAWRCAQTIPVRRSAFDWLVAKLRKDRLASVNSIVLAAMTIDPQFQGLRLPTLFFNAVKRAARSLDLRHIIGPFRPTGYGQYKALRGVTHSIKLFDNYGDNPETRLHYGHRVMASRRCVLWIVPSRPSIKRPSPP